MANYAGPLRSVVRFIGNIQKSKYRALGLMSHDVIREDDHPVYREAISLLPPEQLAERQLRISRAMILDGKHRQLPRDQWITEETDIPYLNDYIVDVRARLTASETHQAKNLAYRLKPALK